MSYKQQSPLPIIEGGTGTQLFQGGIGTNGYGVILSGLFSTDPLEVIQNTGTAGQVLTSNGTGSRPTFENPPAVGAVTQLTGNGGGAVLPLSGNINIVGDGTTIEITGNPLTNTLTVVGLGGGGGDLGQLSADTGFALPSSGIINIVADISSQHAGSTVSFSGTSNTITLNVTDTNHNTIIGNASGNASMSGQFNTIVGAESGSSLTTAIDNVMVGSVVGANLTSGGRNVLVGEGAGNSYTSSESSNILIGTGVAGTLAESNTLRIGSATGSSANQINRTFIAGIDGRNVGSVATVVTESGNQLGTAVITAGDGIIITPGANTITITSTGGGAGNLSTLTGDSGGALLPTANNINVKAGTSSQNSGSSVSMSGSGSTLTLNVTDSNSNTIVGRTSGNGSISGTFNTVLGINSGSLLTSGTDNVMVGGVVGHSITSGGRNVLLGVGAGNNYTSSEDSNIIIGSNISGTVGESHVLRIGLSTGTGSSQLNKTFIAGIDGRNVGDVATVVTEFGNQLGTATITAGSGIIVTPTANTITITATGGGGGGVATLRGDVGPAILPSSGNINIISNLSTIDCGSSVFFSGSGNTLSLNVTDTFGNTTIGEAAGNATMSGPRNTALGKTSGQDLTVGTDNVLLGFDAGAALTSGSYNVIIGSEAGVSYSSSESSNIVINAAATPSDSHTLRIGSGNGTGTQQLNRAFIQGIFSATSSGSVPVFINSSGQLGTLGGTELASTFFGDTGAATPFAGAVTIKSGTSIQNSGSSVSFDGSGSTLTLNVTDANNNTIVGRDAGKASISGIFNTVFGINSGSFLTSGTDNVILGAVTGHHLTSGGRNVLVGVGAGNNYTSSEDSNIVIGSNISGTVGESHTLRIGVSTGSGSSQINRAFVAGISGISVTGAAVLVSASGQLGVAISSKNVKHNIQDMNDNSSAILDLRPVTFAYNDDASETKQYGLIAEEVNEIFPDIVVKNKDGEVETVQYHVLPVLLLNEIKKLNAVIANLNARIDTLEARS